MSLPHLSLLFLLTGLGLIRYIPYDAPFTQEFANFDWNLKASHLCLLNSRRYTVCGMSYDSSQNSSTVFWGFQITDNVMVKCLLVWCSRGAWVEGVRDGCSVFMRPRIAHRSLPRSQSTLIWTNSSKCRSQPQKVRRNECRRPLFYRISICAFLFRESYLQLRAGFGFGSAELIVTEWFCVDADQQRELRSRDSSGLVEREPRIAVIYEWS
ncbi:hypothetical protein B0H13DRAFT_1858948 [Mycena leptocephala]|nr:hypothetical protein B0H13DRAFT_1858948 [Mycena leptocephala]